jgi:hypothetical protein
MRQPSWCFLCENNETEPADMCEQCQFRIRSMRRAIDSALETAGFTPVRTWAKQRIAELKAQHENTAEVK